MISESTMFLWVFRSILCVTPSYFPSRITFSFLSATAVTFSTRPNMNFIFTVFNLYSLHLPAECSLLNKAPPTPTMYKYRPSYSPGKNHTALTHAYANQVTHTHTHIYRRYCTRILTHKKYTQCIKSTLCVCFCLVFFIFSYTHLSLHLFLLSFDFNLMHLPFCFVLFFFLLISCRPSWFGFSVAFCWSVSVSDCSESILSSSYLLF